MPYPSKLELSNENDVADGTASSNINTGGTSGGSGSSSGSSSATHKHNFTVNTIRPLARHYVDFPHDRHVPLTVPGIAGGTYDEVFEPVFYHTGQDPRAPKIFYGRLVFTEQTAEFDGFAEVKLLGREWTGEELINHFTIRIDVSSWLTKQREYVLHEIKVARQEHEAAWQKGDESKQSWLFFMGTRDESDTNVFNVSDYRLICCLTGDFKRLNRRSIPSLRTTVNVASDAHARSVPPRVSPSTLEVPRVNNALTTTRDMPMSSRQQEVEKLPSQNAAPQPFPHTTAQETPTLLGKLKRFVKRL